MHAQNKIIAGILAHVFVEIVKTIIDDLVTGRDKNVSVTESVNANVTNTITTNVASTVWINSDVRCKWIVLFCTLF